MATGMPDEVWRHIVGFVDVWDPTGWRCVARLAATCTETRRALLLFCATRKLSQRSPQQGVGPTPDEGHALVVQLQASFPRPKMSMALQAKDGTLHTWTVPMLPTVDSADFRRSHICSWHSYTLFDTTPDHTFYAAVFLVPRRALSGAPPDAAYSDRHSRLKTTLRLETRCIVYELCDDGVALGAMERFTGRAPVSS